jgi:hypothetical protein
VSAFSVFVFAVFLLPCFFIFENQLVPTKHEYVLLCYVKLELIYSGARQCKYRQPSRFKFKCIYVLSFGFGRKESDLKSLVMSHSDPILTTIEVLPVVQYLPCDSLSESYIYIHIGL